MQSNKIEKHKTIKHAPSIEESNQYYSPYRHRHRNHHRQSRLLPYRNPVANSHWKQQQPAEEQAQTHPRYPQHRQFESRRVFWSGGGVCDGGGGGGGDGACGAWRFSRTRRRSCGGVLWWCVEVFDRRRLP